MVEGQVRAVSNHGQGGAAGQGRQHQALDSDARQAREGRARWGHVFSDLPSHFFLHMRVFLAL